MDTTERKILYYLFVSSAILAVIFVVFLRNLLKHYRVSQRLHKKVAAIEMQTLEKERSRIKQDLHDDIAPLVATTRALINNLEVTKARDVTLANTAMENLDVLVDKLRAISNDLVPVSLYQAGLLVALQDLIDQLQLTSSCSFYFSHPTQLQLPRDIELHAYRIIKESLHNCIKYAQAQHCNVCITLKRKEIGIQVIDDGIGFQFPLSHQGGLNNIAFRVTLLNGDFEIVTAPSQGTTLNIQIPLTNSSAYDKANNAGNSRRHRDIHERPPVHT